MAVVPWSHIPWKIHEAKESQKVLGLNLQTPLMTTKVLDC